MARLAGPRWDSEKTGEACIEGRAPEQEYFAELQERQSVAMRYFVENLWRPLEHLGEHPPHLRAGNCLGSYRITEEALHAIFQRSPLYSRCLNAWRRTLTLRSVLSMRPVCFHE
jgi:hypothetical protein